MCVCYIFNLLSVIELIADKKHNGQQNGGNGRQINTTEKKWW